MGKRLSNSTGTSVNFGTSLGRHYMNIDPLNDKENHSFQSLGYSLWKRSKKSSGKKINLNKSTTSTKRCNSPLNP